MKEIVIALIASGLFSVIASGVFALITEAIKKKEVSLKDLKESLDNIGTDMGNLKNNQLEMARDRIKHICRSRIKDGYITSDEYEDLTALHSSYKALGGNGYCDKLMNRVEQLPIR